MRIEQQPHELTIADEPTTGWFVGICLPIICGLFVALLASSWSTTDRVWLAIAFFAAQAVVLAMFRAPRTAAFDLQSRELRLTIGWLPGLRRVRTFPFQDIREAKVWRSLPGRTSLGYFRPQLILHSGERILLSTFFRSQRECTEIVTLVLPALFPGPLDGSCQPRVG
jgi:hypothetical protein